MALRTLYPELKIRKEYRLPVSAIHTLHIQESGNPEGKPVLFNHGGPGSGINKDHARQFDPSFFRIIQFDQRGSGRSTPYADIRENTTQDLILDIEQIRGKLLNIDKWLVAGRSWGTTLSLLYAQKYPERVTGLFLPAVFLCDKQSIRWLFQDGVSHIYSEEWEKFCSLVPPDKRHDMVSAYRAMLFGEDKALGVKAARTWSNWEAQVCSLRPDQTLVDDFAKDDVMLSLARLECHYLGNAAPGFIEEGQILRDAHRIKDMPCKIIHGRYDVNCTHDNAARLHAALPNSELITVPAGGHAANDPATIDAQVRAADALKEI